MVPVSDSMLEITTGLLLFIQSQMNLFNSIEPPHIEFMSVEEISDFACAKPCGIIKGWTPPGDTVYLSNDLSINQDMFDRSIVLHELVHYVQYRYKLTEQGSDCLTWKAREAQAYKIQYEWLRLNKVRYNTMSLDLTMRNFHRVQCSPNDTAAHL